MEQIRTFRCPLIGTSGNFFSGRQGVSPCSVATLRDALKAKETDTLKGILWHQGESNHGNPDGYAEKLARLVEGLREDLGSEKLPFVAGQIIGPSPINDEIARLPELCPNTEVASSESLKTYDRWHFDSDSVKELGRRYAAAMDALLE